MLNARLHLVCARRRPKIGHRRSMFIVRVRLLACSLARLEAAAAAVTDKSRNGRARVAADISRRRASSSRPVAKVQPHVCRRRRRSRRKIFFLLFLDVGAFACCDGERRPSPAPPSSGGERERKKNRCDSKNNRQQQ